MRSRRRTVAAAAVAAFTLIIASCSDDAAEAPDTGAGTDTTVESGAGTDDTTVDEEAGSPLLVRTDLGSVQGGESAVDGIRSFLNIPYAAAPTGENAWRPPQPREPWDQPLDATEPGPSCPQTSEGVTTAFLETPEADPDCLSLNVWTPEDAEQLPVMVWIHGGGLSTGSAHEPYYIGDDLAAEGVVVASMNYRLGPQGFLATEQLALEGDDAVGNYGFLDQQAALEWVRANIGGFGGDPDAVTIFGESAGGFSVCGHLAAPGSVGLFDQAIVQSGGGCDGFESRDRALADGAAFLRSAGCDDMACLRELSDDELNALEDFGTGLVADGVVLSETAHELAERDELGDIPVFIGSNADEATLFTIGQEEPSDADLVELAASFSDDPEALVALYPAEEFDTNLARYQAMFTDVRFTCPTMAFASVVPESFVYHYTYVSAQNPLDLGATHGGELASLFSHPEGIVAIEIERDETSLELSDLIQQAWSAFATDGDPGDAFDPYADGGSVTLLEVPFEPADQIRGGRCEQVGELTILR